jgi:hypothetical protein
MKATAILKDKTEAFYHGNQAEGGTVPAFLALPPVDQFSTVCRLALEKRATVKIGNGSFRDRVEANQILRGPHRVTFKLEPRRGYKLATFELLPA